MPLPSGRKRSTSTMSGGVSVISRRASLRVPVVFTAKPSRFTTSARPDTKAVSSSTINARAISLTSGRAGGGRAPIRVGQADLCRVYTWPGPSETAFVESDSRRQPALTRKERALTRSSALTRSNWSAAPFARARGTRVRGTCLARLGKREAV